MVLHIIFDDLFGDYVYEHFSRFEGICDIRLLSHKGVDIEYVKRYRLCDVVFCETESYLMLLKSLNKYNAVIMHGLFSKYQYEIVRALPDNVKLAWVVWGAEVYSRSNVLRNNLSPITCLLYRFRMFLKSLSNKQNHISNEVPIDILERVDYLMEESPEVCDYVKKFIHNDKLQFLSYSYYSLEDVIGADLYNKTVHGDALMVDNSAILEGNHIEAFIFIKKNKLDKNRRVIVPLSYGEAWVRKYVMKIGRFLFGSRFVPLLSFLPITEYNRIICSCSTVVMNHRRPHALGNILVALWVGCRVYVSKYNSQTKFLKGLGLHIYTIEDDMVESEYKYSPLSYSEILENRNILIAVYGRGTIENYIVKVIEVLDGR